MSHQQPIPIQAAASVFQQQQYESAAFMLHQPRNQASAYMHYPELNPQQEQLEAAAFAFPWHQRHRNPIQAAAFQQQQNQAAAFVFHQQPVNQAAAFQQQQNQSAAFVTVFHQQPMNQASALQPQQNQAPVIQITVDVEDESQEFSFELDREEQIALHSRLVNLGFIAQPRKRYRGNRKTKLLDSIHVKAFLQEVFSPSSRLEIRLARNSEDKSTGTDNMQILKGILQEIAAPSFASRHIVEECTPGPRTRIRDLSRAHFLLTMHVEPAPRHATPPARR